MRGRFRGTFLSFLRDCNGRFHKLFMLSHCKQLIVATRSSDNLFKECLGAENDYQISVRTSF